jgi:CubicO group peptidase (beta-lactamase class C family)
MKRISSALAVTMALAALACAQPPQSNPTPNLADKELAARIDSLVDKAAAEDSFSGAVLVAKDGQTIFQKAVGFANKETRLPNKIATKFNLGSINKSFTSVAIAQLAQKGKLQYSDTIDRHLPDYPNKAVAEKVTIHQLLTHSSGLGDYLNNATLAQVKTLEDLLPLFVDQPLLFAPGEKQQYSNSGYVVLGLIIEKLSGQSYYNYVKENIFKPAGMTMTDSYELNQKVDDLAVGYTSMSREGPQAGPRRANTSTLAGKGSSAGGGYSTVEDMLKFTNALVANKLLTPEFTEIVFTGGGPKKPAGPGGGYGFMQNQMNGVRIVGNGGGGPGVNAMFRIYFGRGYVVVVLSNYDPPSAQAIAGKIQEMIIAN